jgi:hypothetical protein
MEEITKFILSEYKYSCMVWPNNESSPSYADFYKWNIKCLQESPNDVVWLNELCTRMANYKIKLMDENTNEKHEAYAFYYGNDRTIVICTPRQY